jgi:hypothetical protein
MNRWKKIFRMAGVFILILLASSGLFAGALMLPRTKEKFMNKVVTIELLEQKKEKAGDQLKN